MKTRHDYEVYSCQNMDLFINNKKYVYGIISIEDLSLQKVQKIIKFSSI